MAARQHQHSRRKQIGAERGRRHAVDAARLCIRSEQETGDDQYGRERKTGDGVKDVRSERVDADDTDARQDPGRAEGHRRDGKPAPHPNARERKRGRSRHRKIDVECPIVGVLGGDEKRGKVSADETEACQRGSMQQRGGERCERHDPEQDESRARSQEVIERVGGIDIGIGDGGAGGREGTRDMRRR